MRCKTYSPAVAVKAVTANGFIRPITAARVKYVGRKSIAPFAYTVLHRLQDAVSSAERFVLKDRRLQRFRIVIIIFAGGTEYSSGLSGFFYPSSKRN